MADSQAQYENVCDAQYDAQYDMMHSSTWKKCTAIAVFCTAAAESHSPVTYNVSTI